MTKLLSLLGNANTIFSPYSLLKLLALLAPGTKGELKARLEKLSAGAPTISSGKDIFTSQDAIWYLSKAIWDQDYLDKAKALGAKIGLTGTVDPINRWAGECTQGMITEVLPYLPADFVAGFFNATYFKGDWAEPFKASATRKAGFHNIDGTTTKIEYLNGRKEVRSTYASGATFGFIPYQGGTEALYIIPDKFEPGQAGHWLELSKTQAYDRDDVTVKIPKMTLSSSLDLSALLVELGLGDLFKGGFKGLLSPGGVTSVSQAAKIEVDEKGTRAAAVSMMVMASCVRFSRAVPIIADRPHYLFLIKEGVPLFAASVVTGPV